MTNEKQKFNGSKFKAPTQPISYALDLGDRLSFVGDIPAEPVYRMDAMGNPIAPYSTNKINNGIPTGPETMNKPKEVTAQEKELFIKPGEIASLLI